jgi:hypothetical protein
MNAAVFCRMTSNLPGPLFLSLILIHLRALQNETEPGNAFIFKNLALREALPFSFHRLPLIRSNIVNTTRSLTGFLQQFLQENLAGQGRRELPMILTSLESQNVI